MGKRPGNASKAAQRRPIKTAGKPLRRRRSTRWVTRLLFGLFLVLLMAGGGGVSYLYFGSSTVRQMVFDWRSGMWEPARSFPGRSEVTIMFLGKDVDLDNRAQVVNTNGRTDTIMLARLDFAGQTANLLSIPRDTLVRIPGYRGRHKINAAHALGGPDLTAETIESFLGVHTDEFVVVDYTSFEEAIDHLGGLYVSVPKEMHYDDNWGNLHIHLKPGPQILTGEQALGFVRFRKSNDGVADSDQDRIARQQQLLMAGKSKIASASTFLKLPDIIETVHSGVNSSMNDAQLMTLAKFIKSLPPESIQAATLPGSTGPVYVTADESAAQELVDRMF